MSFTRHETPDEDDFYNSLVKNPQDVEIVDVGQLYDVEDKPAQKYFILNIAYVRPDKSRAWLIISNTLTVKSLHQRGQNCSLS